MIITGTDLTELITSSNLITRATPMVGGASVDLTLGDHILLPENEEPFISLLDGGRFLRLEIPTVGYLLDPGETILGNSAEYLTMPANICGFVSLRSTAARVGLNHLMSGFVHPGYSGHLTFELTNTRSIPILLKSHDRLLQLVLLRTSGESVYDGRYQGAQGGLGPK